MTVTENTRRHARAADNAPNQGNKLKYFKSFCFSDSETIHALIKIPFLQTLVISGVCHCDGFPRGHMPKWHLEPFSGMSDVMFKIDPILRAVLI